MNSKWVNWILSNSELQVSSKKVRTNPPTAFYAKTMQMYRKKSRQGLRSLYLFNFRFTCAHFRIAVLRFWVSSSSFRRRNEQSERKAQMIKTKEQKSRKAIRARQWKTNETCNKRFVSIKTRKENYFLLPEQLVCLIVSSSFDPIASARLCSTVSFRRLVGWAIHISRFMLDSAVNIEMCGTVCPMRPFNGVR